MASISVRRCGTFLAGGSPLGLINGGRVLLTASVSVRGCHCGTFLAGGGGGGLSPRTHKWWACHKWWPCALNGGYGQC